MEQTIIDISLPLMAELAVWPGSIPFTLTQELLLEREDSVNLTTIAMSAHTGTHVDAPYHFDADGATLEALDLAIYWGPAQVVTVTKSSGPLMPEDLSEYNLRLAPRLLVRTPLGRKSFSTFSKAIPYPHPELADFLGLNGIMLYGTDAPSMDAVTSKTLPGHKAMLRNRIAILESLNLRDAPDGLYELVALPLKIAGGDGSPVRAVLRSLSS